MTIGIFRCTTVSMRQDTSIVSDPSVDIQVALFGSGEDESVARIVMNRRQSNGDNADVQIELSVAAAGYRSALIAACLEPGAGVRIAG
jgi:hypothetical protein